MRSWASGLRPRTPTWTRCPKRPSARSCRRRTWWDTWRPSWPAYAARRRSCRSTRCCARPRCSRSASSWPSTHTSGTLIPTEERDLLFVVFISLTRSSSALIPCPTSKSFQHWPLSPLLEKRPRLGMWLCLATFLDLDLHVPSNFCLRFLRPYD